MNLKDENKLKIVLSNIIDFVLVFFLLMLSLKKGGFYKTDTLFFNLAVNILAILNVLIHYIYNLKNNNKRNNKIDIFLLLFSIAFFIPVVLKNYSSLNDSIFEMLRYYNMYLIYTIVSNSFNKKVYIKGIIVVSVILSILGVDQIASGYLDNVLSYINSGYLTSNNLDRMSSTIQYANVFAIICVISFIFNNEYVKNYKKKLEIESKCITNLIEFILLSSILLSNSRTVILLVIIFIISNILTKNIFFKNNILNMLFSILYVSIVDKLMLVNTNLIYIFSVISYILIFGIYFILYRNKEKNKFNFKDIKCKILFLVSFIVLIVIFSLKMTITLNSESNKSYITKNIYCVNKNENINKLNIEIKELEPDTRYEIEVFQVDKNNKFTLEDKLYYYSTITGKFELELQPIEDLNYINVNINCTKGSLKISKLEINEKEISKDYIFLPSKLIDRLKDEFYIKTSYNLRLEYIKDALKIITLNPKNFIFGIGGEGFRNEYKYYKLVDYSSTEVHNIYIQILLESGAVGATIFISLIIYILKKCKNNNIKISFIFLIIHGIFDLDFSYMIILAIFAIIIGLLEFKDDDKKNIKEKSVKCTICIFNYIKYILSISFTVITTIILISSYTSSKIKVYTILENDGIVEVSNKIKKYEEKVNLDRFEPQYRIKLNEVYISYLQLLQNSINENNSQILQSECNKVIENVISNLYYLQSNESNNTNNLIDISNQYFNYLNEIVNLKYANNKDEGYEYYLNIIYTNIKRLYTINDVKLKEKLNYISKKYCEELNENNSVLEKYKDLFAELTEK